MKTKTTPVSPAPEASGASLPPNNPPRASYSQEIAVVAIRRNPEQPRHDFPAAAEQELADSIAAVGLLQPIVVRELLADELAALEQASALRPPVYELVAGERRWRAHQRLARGFIEAKIFSGLTRAQAAAAALVENLQRADLNAIEEAEGYRALMAAENLTQAEVAARVGKSRPVVANALRMLDLPEPVLAHIREGRLTAAHGVALARFKAWPQVAIALADECVVQHVPASSLETKDLPFARTLQRAGLAVSVQSWQFGGAIPAAIKEGPGFFGGEDRYDAASLDLDLVSAELAQVKERQTAEKAEEEARAEAAREAAARHPQKLKSLADLPHDAFALVHEGEEALVKLAPAGTVLELPNHHGEKCTVCTAPDFFRKVALAAQDLRNKDRKEKLPAAFRRALAEVHKVKKLGAHELALLTYLAQSNDDYNRPSLGKHTLEACGVKLGKKALDDRYDATLLFTDQGLAALRDAADPVTHWRLVADAWLRRFEEDALESDWAIPADGDLCVLLRWILKADDLGLLEETKAGQKQFVEAVKQLPWYAAELAALEQASATEAAPPARKAAKRSDRKEAA